MFVGFNVILFVFLLLLLQQINASSSASPEHNLVVKLMTNYPGSDGETSIVSFIFPPPLVALTMNITELNGFDDRGSTLHLAGRLIATWIDPALKWDMANHQGIKEIFVRASKIWTPDIIQQYHKSELHHSIFISNSDLKSDLVHVSYDGTVTAIYDGPLRTECALNWHHFPYDSSTCNFTYVKRFAEYSFNFGALNINIEADRNFQLKFDPRNKPSTYNNAGNNKAVFLIPIVRSGRFYSRHYVVPSVIFSLLQLSAFLVELDLNRAQFRLSVTLIFMVFYQVSVEFIPMMRNPLVIFIEINFFINVMAVCNDLILDGLVKLRRKNGIANTTSPTTPAGLNFYYLIFNNDNFWPFHSLFLLLFCFGGSFGVLLYKYDNEQQLHNYDWTWLLALSLEGVLLLLWITLTIDHYYSSSTNTNTNNNNSDSHHRNNDSNDDETTIPENKTTEVEMMTFLSNNNNYHHRILSLTAGNNSRSTPSVMRYYTTT